MKEKRKKEFYPEHDRISKDFMKLFGSFYIGPSGMTCTFLGYTSMEMLAMGAYVSR